MVMFLCWATYYHLSWYAGRREKEGENTKVLDSASINEDDEWMVDTGQLGTDHDKCMLIV